VEVFVDITTVLQYATSFVNAYAWVDTIQGTISSISLEYSTFRACSAYEEWFANINRMKYAAGRLRSFIQHRKELNILFIRDTPLQGRKQKASSWPADGNC